MTPIPDAPFSMVLFVVSLLFPAEAERVLRESDATITAAKTLRIEFVIDSKQNARVSKGWLALAEGNRFHHEVEVAGQTAVAISDGKRIGGTEGILFPKGPLTPWHNEVLQSWLGRGGTFLSLLSMSEYLGQLSGEKPGVAERPIVSNATMFPDEKVNGVKTRVVAYDLTWRLPGEGFRVANVRVWVDPKTKLPVRRTMTIGDGRFEDTYTATHTKFEINPRLDDKLFEIPDGK